MWHGLINMRGQKDKPGFVMLYCLVAEACWQKQCSPQRRKNVNSLMRPDYPQKSFGDKRCNFVLLMEALAMNP